MKSVFSVMVSLLFVFAAVIPLQADDPFGSNIAICPPPIEPVALVNPTTITDCTQQGIQAALDVGGHINFDCGDGPVTIPISSQLELNPGVDTVLDGDGWITLDGQELTRIFNKGWHAQGVDITIQNMRFINAKAPSGDAHSGGAIRVGYSGTRLYILDSTFENNTTTDFNTADNQGGAIFVHNSRETVISGSVFAENSAGNGGAFGGIATDLIVYNSRFSNNIAVDTTSGGIVRGYGGAIALDGVDKNYDLGANERVYVCGSLFESNVAIRGGGAIDAVVSDHYGTKTVIGKSTFLDNNVIGLDGGYGQGGAIYLVEGDRAGGSSEDNLEIFDTTFHGNLAGRQGGAVWFTILGWSNVHNSTFEGNRTTAPFNTVGQGGAMAIGGNVNLTNVTFANNHAAYQGGAIHGGGTSNQITLKNTIFYSNTLNYGQTIPSDTRWQGYHTNRTMLDGGQNIQFPRYKPGYDNDVNNWITDNPIFADPQLEPLVNNGGPNPTMALMQDSPAIDAGASGCPAVDQRGFPRDGQCDIGAYEYQSYEPSELVAMPSNQAIMPGGVAQYQITMKAGDTPTQPLSLTATNPYAHLLLSLTPSTIMPEQAVTLTLTDTHSGAILFPGISHTIPITASGSGLEITTQVYLLVGGSRIYLPSVMKN